MNAARRLIRFALPLLCALCAVAAVACLCFILGVLLVNGVSSVDWAFLTSETREGGAAGGIAYQILGTLLLVATALATAIPPALALALLRVVYLDRRPTAAHLIDSLLHGLNGLPSIVVGITGLIVFVHWFDWGRSWLAGGLLLGLMILPTLTLALLERLAAVPTQQIEAAMGLGLSRQQIIRSVWLPQSWTGLLTGSLLGLARAAGETAPILFVAVVFAGVTLPEGIRDNPVLALPYHIFVLAQDSVNPDARANLWGAALVLVGLVALLNLVALPFRLRAHDAARHE